ncbi:hypothetical protein HN011_007935 [Eciton burchellii]|nr:hypothetical protein HN011_007935 [Eciton burchellii]
MSMVKFMLRMMSSNVRYTYQASLEERNRKANRIKNLMKEYKLVYGDLIETKKEKTKRLKLEKMGKIVQEKRIRQNTELYWILQNSQKNLRKITISRPQNELCDESQIIRNTEDIFLAKGNGTVSKEVENKVANPTCNLSRAAEGIDNNETISVAKTVKACHHESVAKESSNKASSSKPDESNVEEKKHDINFKRLPDIIIKNLPSFPIMSNKQESIAQSAEVLSISQSDDPATIKFPSVTKILTQTMSPESKLALEAWKERMIEKLGEHGFQMHQKALLEDGTCLHSCIAQSLLGKEFEIPPRIEPVFSSVQSVLEDVRHVRAIETYVAHTKLHYKGVVDCVASYRGENYVIDWKKSDKQKLNLRETYDGPAQLAAYIGAINVSNLYPFVIKGGLLVIAYTCGAPATVHEIRDGTLQRYWTTWLHRLQRYYVETARNDDNEKNSAIKH